MAGGHVAFLGSKTMFDRKLLLVGKQLPVNYRLYHSQNRLDSLKDYPQSTTRACQTRMLHILKRQHHNQRVCIRIRCPEAPDAAVGAQTVGCHVSVLASCSAAQYFGTHTCALYGLVWEQVQVSLDFCKTLEGLSSGRWLQKTSDVQYRLFYRYPDIDRLLISDINRYRYTRSWNDHIMANFLANFVMSRWMHR